MYYVVYLCVYVLDCSTNVNETDENGWTPLMHAAKSGNYAVAEALVSVGEQVDTARCNHSGHSAADIARFYRHKDVFTLLANSGTLTCDIQGSHASLKVLEST